MGTWLPALIKRWAVWVGYRNLVRLALLFAGMMIFWAGMQSTVRELRGSRGLLLVLAATALGWMIARWRAPGWVGTIVLLAAGLLFVLVISGNLGEPLSKALRAAGDTRLMYFGDWQWRVDAQPLVDALAELGRGTRVLLVRFWEWITGLLYGGTADPVGRTLFWNYLLWCAAASGGWVLRRWEHPLAAFLPAGAVLGAVTAFTGSQAGYMLLYLQLYLILQALQAFFAREQRWEQGGFDAPDLYLDVGLMTLGVSFFLMLLAMLVPSISVSAIARSMYARVNPSREQEVAGSLGLRPAGGAVSVFEPVRLGGLAREHLIGSGPELAEQPVFTITLAGFSGRAPDFETGGRLPLYWRGFVFDRYTGSGWATSAFEQVQYAAGASREIPAEVHDSQGGMLRQTVQKFEPADKYLYYAGDMVAADAYTQLAVRPPEDVFAGWIVAEEYTVDTHVVFENAQSLRQAGRAYPDWVSNRYLQLPANISTQVNNLALDLTAQEPTPYDRAVAIESYLRTFPYTLDLPAPPVGREIADYFLFELQRGYCDYYATTMVVLARAAGLPARLVVGYARGTWQPENQSWLVTEADAHSWVEIYFPGEGWVVFEPTAGLDAIERAETAPAPDALLESAPLPPLVPEAFYLARGFTPLQFGLIFLGLVVMVMLGIGAAWIWRLKRLPPEKVMDRLYQRLWTHARHQHLPLPEGATPLEVTRDLAGSLPASARSREGDTRLVDFLEWTGTVYSRGVYSQHQFTDDEKAVVVHSWLWVNWKLSLLRWAARWARATRHPSG